MGNPLDTSSALQLLTLVTFVYGVTTKRYVNWTEDQTIDGNVYTALPGLKISFKEQHGGSQDETAEVEMRAVEPLTSLVLLPSPRVTVRIEQMPLGDLASKRTVFFGFMGNIVENAGGKPNLYRFSIDGLKTLLNVPLGMQALTECNHIFGAQGDDQCNYDLSQTGRIQTGVLSIVQGSTVEVAGLTATVDTGDGQGAVQHDRLFLRGTVSFGGLEIDVRDYDATVDVDRLVLDYPPPPAWDGETVTVTMGCMRTLADCQERGNVLQIRNLGYKMLDRNPQLEPGD